MKVSAAILEDDRNMVVVPLYWLMQTERQALLKSGYQVIPIPGYRETDGLRAFKTIGPYSDDIWWLRSLSIPIWEDWKLTAQYVNHAERINSTNGIQMFDRLDDDEKIQTFKYFWYNITGNYIIKYFQDHPDLQKRAKLVLNRNDDTIFKDMFR